MSCISHPSVLKHPSDTQRDVESPPPPLPSLKSCFMPRIQQVPSPLTPAPTHPSMSAKHPPHAWPCQSMSETAQLLSHAADRLVGDENKYIKVK